MIETRDIVSLPHEQTISKNLIQHFDKHHRFTGAYLRIWFAAPTHTDNFRTLERMVDQHKQMLLQLKGRGVYEGYITEIQYFGHTANILFEGIAKRERKREGRELV